MSVVNLASAGMDSFLTTATQELKDTLATAAARGDLGRAAADAFGFLSLPESFWQLQQAWASNHFLGLPSILVTPAASMAGALGAYVDETDTIHLNEDWLAHASSADVLAVLVEEVGHHLDARFNTSDSLGDEGELFSRVLLGQLPSISERGRIMAENDSIQVALTNGQRVWAEAADALDPVVRLTGTPQGEQLVGGSNADALFGMGGDDDLVGAAGSDYLDGGTGHDTMAGGLGDDIYVIDSSADIITEAGDEGSDSILSTISYVLPDYVENLDLRTSGEATGFGNDLNNVIYAGFGATHLVGGGGNDSLYGRGASDDHLEGGLGNDYLDGGLGLDLMEGGLGNDTYVVRDSQDVVLEGADAGADWVFATSSFGLTDFVEHLQLFGSGDGLRATGNGLNNTLLGDKWSNSLIGGAGHDYLNGGLGADQMDGGLGDDTYVVDHASDVILEHAAEGTDWVVSTLSHTLGDHVEHLDLRGTEDLVGLGNSAANILKGNLGSSTLHGGAGHDSLYGRGSGRDRLYGDDGNDYLDGGLGADVMEGGAGNDTFVVDDSGDLVTEAVNGGSDWVIADLSYALADNLDGLRLRGRTGSEDLDATGNALDNTILGNAGDNSLSGGDGNDILNGGSGLDTLLGGAGRDVFVLANQELDGSIAADQIGDFETGQDILLLSRAALNIEPARLTSGVLASSQYVVVSSLTTGGLQGSNGLGSSAAFVFDQSLGILYYNANGSEQGAGAFETGIMQIAGSELKSSDIQLA